MSITARDEPQHDQDVPAVKSVSANAALFKNSSRSPSCVTDRKFSDSCTIRRALGSLRASLAFRLMIDLPRPWF